MIDETTQRPPRRARRDLPPGWQVARRADGLHLQQQRASDGAWLDVAGPYKQRSHAIDAYLRRQLAQPDTAE
jgi:hypothetical protein